MTTRLYIRSLIANTGRMHAPYDLLMTMVNRNLLFNSVSSHIYVCSLPGPVGWNEVIFAVYIDEPLHTKQHFDSRHARIYNHLSATSLYSRYIVPLIWRN